MAFLIAVWDGFSKLEVETEKFYRDALMLRLVAKKSGCMAPRSLP